MSELENYIQTFLQEAEELLADIEGPVLSIEERPDDPETFNRLFRAMHTIKGSGAMFGFTEVSAFAHHVETVLDKVRGGQVQVSRELIDLVLASRDQISALIAAANGGPAADTDRGVAIIAGLGALSGEGVAEAAAASAKNPKSTKAARKKRPNQSATYRISFRPEPGIFATGTDPAMLLEEIRELGEAVIVAEFQDLPDLEKMQPEWCYFSWMITLATDKTVDAIRDVFIFVEDISRMRSQKSPPTSPDLGWARY